MADYKHYIEKIKGAMTEDPVDYISRCERRYSSILREYIREVVAKPGNNKIIMLAGPSSSGKTTTANKMARLISRMGYNAYVISLDDFYKHRDEIPVDENGKQDFETVYALELDLLRECLRNLGLKGEADLPHFDFETGRRTDNILHLTLEPGDVVIVEGLHALNPVITECLTDGNLVKMYVSTASDIYYEDDELYMNRREIRFLRRLIRDYKFRNSSVENTYNMWPSVVAGEVTYLTPHMNNADYILDSVHAYELCVYKDTAIDLLSGVDADNENYDNAVYISEHLKLLPSISKELMPKNSLLREFVGK